MYPEDRTSGWCQKGSTVPKAWQWMSFWVHTPSTHNTMGMRISLKVPNQVWSCKTGTRHAGWGEREGGTQGTAVSHTLEERQCLAHLPHRQVQPWRAAAPHGAGRGRRPERAPGQSPAGDEDSAREQHPRWKLLSQGATLLPWHPLLLWEWWSTLALKYLLPTSLESSVAGTVTRHQCDPSVPRKEKLLIIHTLHQLQRGFMGQSVPAAPKLLMSAQNFSLWTVSLGGLVRFLLPFRIATGNVLLTDLNS